MRIGGLAKLFGVSMALALTACGQSAPPSDNASNISPVDAKPAALEGEPDEPVGTYTNHKYGFSVLIPEGWRQLTAAANEDGSIFEDKTEDADLRAYGADNEGDSDFQQAVEALRDGTTDSEGAMVGDREYRGAATMDGDRIRLRLIRTPSGAMAAAMVRYPVAKAAVLDPVAVRVLDSLTLIPRP